jgi:predicted DNA-binding transcriptional regulator AlpA
MPTILLYPDLKPKKGIPYSREHLRRREKAGMFPQHVVIGEGRIGWFETEIDDWLSELVRARSS